MISKLGSGVALVAIVTMAANGAQAAPTAAENCKAAFPAASVSLARFDAVFYQSGVSQPDKTKISPPSGGSVDALICKISKGSGGYQFIPATGGSAVGVDFDASVAPACHVLENVSELMLRNSAPYKWDACVWIRIGD